MMTAEQEAAANDPRVGDKWADNRPMMGLTCEVVEVHEHTVAVNYCGEGPCGMTKRRFIEWISGWSLLSRGPALAAEAKDELIFHPGLGRYIPRSVLEAKKPERDPYTQPVVGDEWTFADQKRRIRFVIGDDLKVDHIYSDGTFNTFRYTTNEVASYVGIWRLYRRGDDPAWRPPEEEANVIADAWHDDPDGWRRVGWNANIAIDDSIIETLNQEWPTLGEFADVVGRDIELVNDTLTAVGRVAVFGGIWKFAEAGSPGNECPEAWKPGLRAAFLSELPAKPEPPAAGIKVGDRVRHHSGDEGVIESRDAYGVKVLYDDDDTPQTFSYRDVEHWLTIIPPAAPEPDDTGDEPPTPEHTGDKYVRVIFPRYAGQSPIQVDVYNVLDAYAVPAGPLHHAAKKILCAGIRGHKGAEQDLVEARDAITRAIEMMRQKQAN